MATKLNFAVSLRSILAADKKVQTNVNLFQKVRARWLEFDHENSRKLGAIVTFPYQHCSKEYGMRWSGNEPDLDCITTNNPSQVILHPLNLSPPEILESTLNELKANPQKNFTLLRSVPLKGNVMVEFGSPNIAKPLHMGHLRSAVTGNFVSRINRACHQDVTNICFLGDWGTQFGLLQAHLSSKYADGNLLEGVQKMGMSELLSNYVAATIREKKDLDFMSESRQCAAFLEQGDGSALDVWQCVRDKTIRHLDETWKELGIQFEHVHGESQYTMKSSHTKHAMDLLESSGALVKNTDGSCQAFILFSENAVDETPITLIKSDGSSLYLLRDLAAAIHRTEQYKFEELIYVVDSSQVNHFKSLFGLLRKLGINPKRDPEEIPLFKHVSFGRVRGQSTRSGNFTLLTEVFNEGTKIMFATRQNSPNTKDIDDESISRNLAISSLIINCFNVRRNKDINFDWNTALASKGDTGVRLQYTHARIASLLTKMGSEFLENENDPYSFKHPINYEYIWTDDCARELALHLLK